MEFDYPVGYKALTLNLTGFSGIKEINNSMAFQVNHYCSVGIPLTESKVIHTNLCDAGFIHKSRHFFFSSSQMLLLQTFMESSFSKAEALTELNLEDVFRILFTSRLVFLSFGAIKSNLSENVLWLQSEFIQNIFLVFNKSIVCRSCSGMSWISR